VIHVTVSAQDPQRPFWQHTDLFIPGTCCFLLDSALAGGPQGRFSFLGGWPAALLTGKRTGERAVGRPAGRQLFRMELTIWKRPDGTTPDRPETRTWTGDPFLALRRLQAEYGTEKATGHEDRPAVGDFRGGLVGYFGYGCAQALEDLPDTGRDDPGLPDLAFMVADAVLGHDHRTGRTTLAVTGRGPTPETARNDARTMTETWGRLLSRRPEPMNPEPAAPDHSVAISGDFDLRSYSAAVSACRERILAGDVFEVCLTHRLTADPAGSPWDLYGRLRRQNPAPFAAWLQFPGFQVVSASPERFLKLDRDRTMESRPIKGTRPRGGTPVEDARLRRELAESPKDRAENLMIVDLVRSDLGRVAEIGSVEVPQLLVVEDYATVFQLVSTIRARLRPEHDALDLVRACFPGGSMTGAPKIEAMKIIDALEPVKRGVYSGAIGYLDRGGAMDLSIVIRTIVCRDGRAHFGVGGAVTADSDPAAEYHETLDKARALVRALGGRLP